ncbi:MAG: DNA repair protein RecO [candidate division WOR-3 bacterium]|nr:DNA repair protein RecO [candidate division WOR-3 bacterium]MCX7836923.1 DNA repair protein RecO [candidate division WOR-3 bacterium]
MDILKKATGFILLRKNFRSTSKIIDFYSKEYGRLLLLAKGIRDGKNYLNGSLEPLNCCEIIFYKKENQTIYFVKDAFLLYNFPLIIKEYKKYSQIFDLNRFLSFILPLEEKNEEVFRLYLLTLFFINFLPYDKIRNIILSFYLKTIALIGFQPSLLACLKCEKKLFQKKDVFFDTKKGGILCSNCQKESKNSFLIDKKILENLWHLSFIPYSKLLDYQIFPETEKIIKIYLNYHLTDSLTLRKILL